MGSGKKLDKLQGASYAEGERGDTMKYTEKTVRRVLGESGNFDVGEIDQFIHYLIPDGGSCVSFRYVLVMYCMDYHQAVKPELGKPEPQPGDDTDDEL